MMTGLHFKNYTEIVREIISPLSSIDQKFYEFHFKKHLPFLELRCQNSHCNFLCSFSLVRNPEHPKENLVNHYKNLFLSDISKAFHTCTQASPQTRVLKLYNDSQTQSIIKINVELLKN